MKVSGHLWKWTVKKAQKVRIWWKSSFVVKMTISKPIDVNTLVMIHSKCPSTQSSNLILWREIKFYSSSATICRYRENGSVKWQWFCFDLYMGQNNHLFTTWHNRTFIGFIVFNSMYECDRKYRSMYSAQKTLGTKFDRTQNMVKFKLIGSVNRG